MMDGTSPAIRIRKDAMLFLLLDSERNDEQLSIEHEINCKPEDANSYSSP